MRHHSTDNLVLVIAAFIAIIALLIVYGRQNTENTRLKNELQAETACIENGAYTRGMILGQCIQDYMEARR